MARRGYSKDEAILAGTVRAPYSSTIRFRPKRSKVPWLPASAHELRAMAAYLKQPCPGLDNSEGEGTRAHEVKNAEEGIDETLDHLRRDIRAGDVRGMLHQFKDLIAWAGIGAVAVVGYRDSAYRPRRKHSRSGQVRCEICSPMRCRLATK